MANKTLEEKIQPAFPPADEDVMFLTDKINEASAEKGIKGGVRLPFGYFIRDESGKMLAGCNGSIIFGGLHIDQLWVDTSLRKTGYGTMLLNKVEELAKKENCTMIYLATMSFLAEEFYTKNGYTVYCRHKGFTNDSEMISLHKYL
ncbi:unnamed protein product [Allacma fusca]|uniref:N-acetyltransferase domain-containing protein n=1 Tax=Allacma fusca TaxID=39272 RepID=A0A8J2J4B3_9HEXA|nr:unnamed protein product [Allacma fusca]